MKITKRENFFYYLATDRLDLVLRPEFIEEEKLHILACMFARDCLHVFENIYPNDNRPRKAIEAKEAWIKGKINNQELTKAAKSAELAKLDAWESWYNKKDMTPEWAEAWAAWDAANACWEVAFSNNAWDVAFKAACSDASARKRQIEMIRKVLGQE